MLVDRSTNYYDEDQNFVSDAVDQHCSGAVCVVASRRDEGGRTAATICDRSGGSSPGWRGVACVCDERGIEHVVVSECDGGFEAGWQLDRALSGREHGWRHDCELRAGEGVGDRCDGSGEVS